MPIFTNKFTPKKTPSRKVDVSLISRQLGAERAAEELGLNIGAIKFHLGNQEIEFKDGNWNAETINGEDLHNENEQLRNSLQKLEEQNNLLKIKIEILLDMLAECTAEFHLQERELKKLKN